MEEFLLILIIEKLEELMVFKNLQHVIFLICFSDEKSVLKAQMIKSCHNALRTLFEIVVCDHCNLKNEVLHRL